MEALTEWTTSLASSAPHLKGLSQQEIFLLNKKKKKSNCAHCIYITHIQCAGVSLPPTYHEILPLFDCLCTSALQCSWVDLMISTAKSYGKHEELQSKRHRIVRNSFEHIQFQLLKTIMDSNSQYKKICNFSLLCLVLERCWYFFSELSIESKLVLRFSIRHLVFPKPVNSGL